jgi:hypothetical protein
MLTSSEEFTAIADRLFAAAKAIGPIDWLVFCYRLEAFERENPDATLSVQTAELLLSWALNPDRRASVIIDGKRFRAVNASALERARDRIGYITDLVGGDVTNADRGIRAWTFDPDPDATLTVGKFLILPHTKNAMRNVAAMKRPVAKHKSDAVMLVNK